MSGGPLLVDYPLLTSTIVESDKRQHAAAEELCALFRTKMLADWEALGSLVSSRFLGTSPQVGVVFTNFADEYSKKRFRMNAPTVELAIEDLVEGLCGIMNRTRTTVHPEVLARLRTLGLCDRESGAPASAPDVLTRLGLSVLGRTKKRDAVEDDKGPWVIQLRRRQFGEEVGPKLYVSGMRLEHIESNESPSTVPLRRNARIFVSKIFAEAQAARWHGYESKVVPWMPLIVGVYWVVAVEVEGHAPRWLDNRDAVDLRLTPKRSERFRFASVVEAKPWLLTLRQQLPADEGTARVVIKRITIYRSHR